MGDRLQLSELALVPENDPGEPPTVDPAILHDRGPSMGNGLEGRARQDVMTDSVGVDHRRTELGQDAGGRALPRADAAGQHEPEWFP